jgi:hypothetical protein
LTISCIWEYNGIYLRNIFFLFDELQGLWPRVIQDRRNSNFYCLLPFKAAVFTKINVLAFPVPYKRGAKLHVSGCGHFGGKSCQLCVSNSSTATRGKQN